MKLSTLAEWLDWIATLHPFSMDLGLDRVSMVAERLHALTPTCPVITIGGTNGKGSTVAALESIYRAAGYRTGVYTSPILFRHNEMVRIDGREASDVAFCDAFALIENIRGEISLTPFEYYTLAALLILKDEKVDVWLLEVGLGGRLDAVNVVDANVAIITSISLDHTEWLGSTRDAIAREKAGIFRSLRPAVCGDPNPPETLLAYAQEIKAPLFCQGKDFSYAVKDKTWSWQCVDVSYTDLPIPSLYSPNMAAALMAIQLLQSQLTVSQAAIASGLQNVTLPGRQQIVPGEVTHIYDVSHNPDAVKLLATRLMQLPCIGKTLAVFSMLADKDIVSSISNIKAVIDDWYVAPLATSRAASQEQLQKALVQAGIQNSAMFSTIKLAYQAAIQQAKLGDRIVVFGSFHTVAESVSLRGHFSGRSNLGS